MTSYQKRILYALQRYYWKPRHKATIWIEKLNLPRMLISKQYLLNFMRSLLQSIPMFDTLNFIFAKYSYESMFNYIHIMMIIDFRFI